MCAAVCAAVKPLKLSALKSVMSTQMEGASAH